MKVLVTGSDGFIGKNMCVRLRQNGYEVFEFNRFCDLTILKNQIIEADYIVHLAGANRPQDIKEFENVNVSLTKDIISLIKESKKVIPIIFSSSIKATENSLYGISKLEAEKNLLDFMHKTGNPVYIYRLSNIFGRWCKPNYNSVVATFCYNIARNLPVEVKDDFQIIELTYIDDVTKAFLHRIETEPAKHHRLIHKFYTLPTRACSLFYLKKNLEEFKTSRETMRSPMSLGKFEQNLYVTYASYIPEDELKFDLSSHKDLRGSITEFFKTSHEGQLYLNEINPGFTKGNHYHNFKTERYFVIEGECLISLRKVGEKSIKEIKCSGNVHQMIDIPSGYVHNIKNIGDKVAKVIMWSSSLYSPQENDTFLESV